MRFGTTYLGSSVYAGVFDTDLLSYKNPNGVTMADAVRAFGGDPDALAEAARDVSDLLGYFEVHIEQGPVLEGLGLPIAVVSGIVGESSVKIEVLGEAGHAETLEMEKHREALCAGAEFMLAEEETTRKEPGMVATVDHISVHPSAHTVIPSAAPLGIDLRHEDDLVREHALLSLRDRAEAIAAARGGATRWHVHQESLAVPADPKLMALVAQAIAEVGYSVERLPSGAGHDAAAVVEIAPIAMLLVRCRGGTNHNPAESVESEDVAAAIEATSRFLDLLAEASWR